jgi:hypothetical protein
MTIERRAAGASRDHLVKVRVPTTVRLRQEIYDALLSKARNERRSMQYIIENELERFIAEGINHE